MRYYSVRDGSGRRLVALDGTGDRFDLTAASPDVCTFGDLARAAAVTGRDVDDVAAGLCDAAGTTGPPDDPGRPVDPAEVWAAGVTYEISEEARESESEMPDIYLDVYGSERPELFFKATPGRTVGPGEAVGVRGDSTWDVPEPELGVVLYRGDVVGYTVGNDVSSRAIEGRNPLYLPQAKVYDRCCALGPCVASTGTVPDPHDLRMEMTIVRDGATVFEDATTTGRMTTTCEELVSYYARHNHVPRLSVLLTGTALVPEDEFTLRPGDEVTVSIEDVGTLYNGVTEV